MIVNPMLIVVSDDPLVTRSVTSVLESSVDGGSHRRLNSLHEVSYELMQMEACTILVDIDAAPHKILDDMHSLIGQFPQARFLAIATEQISEYLLKAMKAGVRDFLVKSTLSTTLPSVLQHLAPAVVRNGQLGHIMITVLAAGGGCGATTFAINLAHELYQLRQEPTLLIDLVHSYGGASAALNLSSEYGIADVLTDASRIDGHLIQSTAVTYNNAWQMLVSPAATPPDRMREFNYENIQPVMACARQVYSYIISDASRLPGDVMSSVVRASSMTFLLFEANVANIRATRKLLDFCKLVGVDESRILPVVNRYRHAKTTIDLAKIKKALNRKELLTLSNDFKGVTASINYGKTLADCVPRSRFRRDVQRVAHSIAERSSLTNLVKVIG